MSEALRTNDSSAFVSAAAKSHGYRPLVQNALEYATAGVTSLTEVFRVAEQVDESVDFINSGIGGK